MNLERSLFLARCVLGAVFPVLRFALTAWLLALPLSRGAEAQADLVTRLVQDGLLHVEWGRYSDAINVLEEAWEIDPSNPTVAENLALAYLYEEHPPSFAALERAEVLMRASLEQGGRASVLANHLHKRMQWLTNMDSKCPGKFTISSQGFDFVGKDELHSFSLEPSQVAEMTLATGQRARSTGVFRLETTSGTRYPMRPGTGTEAEARLLLELAEEFTLGGG